MPEFEMMGLLSWVVMGLLAGLLGRFLTPGRDAMGCVMTVLTGIVGAIVGGFVATWAGFGGFRGFDVYSLLVATAGAVLFLIVLRLLRGGKRESD